MAVETAGWFSAGGHLPKLNRTELCKVLGGWGAYIYTYFPAVRVLPARSEARELLAFFTVARASATDFKAAPPPGWGNMARTTGGGSVKVSTHYIQHKPISRPRFKKNVCNTAEREKIRADYVCRIRPRWRRSTIRALMYDRQ